MEAKITELLRSSLLKRLHRNRASMASLCSSSFLVPLHIHFQHPADSAVNQIVIIQETAALIRLIHDLIQNILQRLCVAAPQKDEQDRAEYHTQPDGNIGDIPYEVTGVQQLAPVRLRCDVFDAVTNSESITEP